MTYATRDELREWLGTNAVSTTLLDICLDEAESSLRADLGVVVGPDPDPILADAEALTIARGEVLRRAQRNLARRNSPEGISGLGDLGAFRVPVRDPDSQVSMNRLRAILVLGFGVA